METRRFPIDGRWLEQILVPYLRYAFSDVIVYDADIWPKVWGAVQFCMQKPDNLIDFNDLAFERICLAIEYRYKELEPDLTYLTESMEKLATYLIRRAQIKGPYELLGRVNTASTAWIQHRARRLETEISVKNEQNDLIVLSHPSPKPVPTDDVIDPRLIIAQPGDFTSRNLIGVLTMAEEQYYRHQIQLVNWHHQNKVVPTLNEQLQSAATQSSPNQTSYQIPGRGWSYGQQPTYTPPPRQRQSPSYVQNLGQQQSQDAFYPCPYPGNNGLNHDYPANTPVNGGFGTLRPPPSKPSPLPTHTHTTTTPPHPPNPNVQQTHSSNPEPMRQYPNQWDQVAHHRAQAFTMLPQHQQHSETRRLQQYQPQVFASGRQEGYHVPAQTTYQQQQQQYTQQASYQQSQHHQQQSAYQQPQSINVQPGPMYHPAPTNIHGAFPGTQNGDMTVRGRR
ncbi:hypothetical protein GQ44DRAFT_775119 [Phaeosphaeriaceae sp. PMI808]|nr:hypothetical protein GQ44DRAFT_775119 [Phaeosphaeriaceae sp. PMI808]